MSGFLGTFFNAYFNKTFTLINSLFRFEKNWYEKERSQLFLMGGCLSAPEFHFQGQMAI